MYENQTPNVSYYEKSFLVLLFTFVLAVVLPWVHQVWLAPLLERRRLAALDAKAVRTREDVIAAARQAAIDNAASLTLALSLDKKAKQAAKAYAEADLRLRALRGGMQSYYATDNIIESGWINDEDVKARRAEAKRRLEAAQQEIVAAEQARREAAALVEQAEWDAEEAARKANLGPRNERHARPPSPPPPPRVPTPPPRVPTPPPRVPTPPPPTPSQPSPRAMTDALPSHDASAPRPRKRVLTEEELAAARREIAELRIPPEPAPGTPGAVSLVIESVDFRGNFRVARRFSPNDPLRALLDVIQAGGGGIPGGMSGRQLEVRHPKGVLVSWRDYSLRELRFDTEFSELKAAIAAESSLVTDSAGSDEAVPAAAAAAVEEGSAAVHRIVGDVGASPAMRSSESRGAAATATTPSDAAVPAASVPREFVTLRDAGLSGRVSLALRPIDP